MMTESDSSTNTEPMTGSSRAVSVSMATMPKVTPKAMAPVSPMKNRAGLTLNQRKAAKAPAIAPQKAAKSVCPLAKAMAAKALKLAKRTPPAKPSRPSVSLTENDVATITKTKNSGYQTPSETSPTKGTRNVSQPRL